MKGILISGLHHWGFSVRVPKASAGGSSYPYVPISTILGALSRGYCSSYAVKDGTSCTEEFISNYKPYIFWVAYGTDEPRLLHYADILREQRVSYRQDKYRRRIRKEKDKEIDNMREWFGVSAFGRTYAEDVKFSIAVLVKDKAEEVSKYAWQIVSLGSKESIVTVTDVKIVDAVNVETEEISTSFFIPRVCVGETEGMESYKLSVSNAYNLSKEPVGGIEDEFWIPSHGPLIGGNVKLKGKVSEECTVFKLEDKYLITLKEGLWKWLK
ncbi:type I-A CRISPR-associated protein Cas5a [Acidianus sp. HS-5]|uniref:type I-A CRISPR-associated protein Cas5a n=1 Tax=Acidianus sp. HS-5 TaxID=2886040 RepID=UPI001F01D964|nr:type I-A CRISPR-associated protein Cas5a [Acidianus sp. HS-5]BDC18760.1 type I-A CRISPR-associated protein Cas5 [Acidianus sp. HS-5]